MVYVKPEMHKYQHKIYMQTLFSRVVGPVPSRDLTGLHNYKKIDVSNFTPAAIENYQPDHNETWHDLPVTPD